MADRMFQLPNGTWIRPYFIRFVLVPEEDAYGPRVIVSLADDDRMTISADSWEDARKIRDSIAEKCNVHAE